MTKTKRAAIYVRISDDKTGRAAGVKRQEADCQALAERRGLTVTLPVFADNDRSATNGKPRPEFERLIAAVEAGEVDTILVWHIDRLYRRPIELERLLTMIEVDGALPGGVLTVTAGDFDLNTSAGRMVARMLVAAAKAEAERASERIRSSQREAARLGKPHGGRRRFGYSRSMEVVPSEAEAIREAVTNVTAGASLYSVARRWNEDGAFTPKGKRWEGQSVRDVLLSPGLAGMRVYGGEIVGEAQWEGIVSEPEWRRLHAVLTAPNRPKVDAPRNRYLLSGRAKCGKCGASLASRRRRDGVRILACRPDRACGGCSTVAEPAEAVVLDAIDAVLQADRKLIVAEGADTAPAIEPLEQRLAELDAAEDELAEKLTAGTISDSLLAKASQRIADERDALRDEIAAAMVRPTFDLGAEIDGWRDALDSQRAMLDALVESVTVLPATPGAPRRFDPDRIEIKFN